MTRIHGALLAPVLFALAQSPALGWERDTGWGAPYNSHLDSYSGRPLGPPLPMLPPGYQYYNGRLVRVPYAGPALVYVPVRPRHSVRRHGVSARR